MLLSRALYYLSSIPTLLLGVRNWPTMLAAFLRLPVRRGCVIELRSGLAFRVRDAMDIWIIKETCLDRQYELASVPIEDGWTVIDVGAGLGDFATSVAKRCPNSTVYAYEPSPDSFALLLANCELNGVHNVVAYPHAVGSRSATAVLYAGATPVQHSTEQRGDQRRAVVESVALGSILDQHGLPSCDFLKIDCEGAEYDILLNTDADVVRRFRHICLEYHERGTAHSRRDLVQRFAELGYHVRTTPNRAHGYLGLLHAQRPTESMGGAGPQT